MEEESLVTVEKTPVKLLETKIEEVKKEDDDSAIENDFIKVEKELIDVKDHSALTESSISEKEQSCSPKVNLSSTEKNSEMMKAQEKIRQLKIELGNLSEELRCAEFEKAKFQAEVSVVNERLHHRDKYCEDLENDLKRLKEEMMESGLKHQSQLESLQESLQAHEANQKELKAVKQAFDGLYLELESSRKKVEELESDLLSSTDEVRKLEALSSEKDLHADLQSKKALELKNMLEVAKLDAKEWENQMGLLQEELKVLYEKTTHSQNTEEALSKTTLELSVVQKELELSKLQVFELEQKVASEEAAIQELARELDQHKTSEQLLRKDMMSLEISLSSSKEDLQAKAAILNENELKLQKELAERKAMEVNLHGQESQMRHLHEELIRAYKEKEELEMATGELNNNLLEFEEKYTDLENKLDLANQNLMKTDSLLSESLSLNADLQEKLKSLEEIKKNSGVAAETLSQKNTELEDLMKVSNTALEDVKAQLKETETTLASVVQRNAELEEQLNVSDLKYKDIGREVAEFRDKASDLSNLLKASEEENALSRCHFQGYQDRMNQLESSLKLSSSKNLELEKKLKELAEKSAEHESRSTSTHERNLELEELIHVAHSKSEKSGNRAEELEFHLESMNKRTVELEEQLNNIQLKHKDTEEELKQKSSQVSELSLELEAFQVKSSSLEVALEAANNKESELLDLLNAVTEGKKKIEDLSRNSGEKLVEAENLIDVLQTELNSAKEKLQNVLEDLEASGVREKDILEKLKSAEEHLEQQGRNVASANARILDLESSNETLCKETELRHKEATLSFVQKDSEAKMLEEKLKSLKEEAVVYKDQAVQATSQMELLKRELEESSNKIVSLEDIVDELKTKLLEMEQGSHKSFMENEFLTETNMNLNKELEAHQCKISDLHERLISTHSEKDSTAEQLAFHVKALSELRDEHLKVVELHSEAESHKKEQEVQLSEAFEKLTHRDSENKGMIDEIHELERKMKLYEEQLREAAVSTEAQASELDEALSKLRILEKVIKEGKDKTDQLESANECLAEANMKLTQELAENETKINNMQTQLNMIQTEKEDAFGEISLLRKTNEDMGKNRSSESELLQSQISSLMEEKDMLNQLYQEARKEIEAVVLQMEEQSNERQAKEHQLNQNLEILAADQKVKLEMQMQVAELEKKLLSMELQFREEIESIRTASTDREAKMIEEYASKLKEKDALCEQLEPLKGQLNLAHTTIAEQDNEERRLTLLNAEMEKKIVDLENELQAACNKYEKYKSENVGKDQMDVKSRDIDLGITPLTKRKNKKGTKRSSSETTEIPATPTTEPSRAMAFKFILGVALVSMILGVILGKRY